MTWTDKRIVIDGPIKSDDGYGHMTENQILAFDALGYDVYCGMHWTNITNLEFVHPRVAALAKRGITRQAVGVRNSQPDSFEHCPSVFRMGFSMFEFTKVPQAWHQGLNWGCHVNLVPSTWCKEIWLEAGVTKPVEVNLLGVDTEVFTAIQRPPRDVFTFYMSGTLSGRKAPHLAWEAFQAAFPGRTDVRLVVKSARHLPLAHLGPADDPRITFIDEGWTKAQMVGALHAADCFVYPTRSEGFGLSPAEAMATGLPVICTAETGCRDFVLEDHAYPLSIDGWENVPSHWGDIGAYTSPSKEHLIALMQHVESHRAEAYDKGQRAATYVRNGLTWRHHAERLITIVERYL